MLSADEIREKIILEMKNDVINTISDMELTHENYKLFRIILMIAEFKGENK